MARISYEIKERMVALAGACFWYWNSFYSFLESCSVPRALQHKYPKESHNKYSIMRNILNELEDRDETEVVKQIVSNFYRMTNAIDREKLDQRKAKMLLAEFRDAIGTDPLEDAIRSREAEKAREEYRKSQGEADAARTQLQALNKKFLELPSNSEFSPQKRGFELEGSVLICRPKPQRAQKGRAG